MYIVKWSPWPGQQRGQAFERNVKAQGSIRHVDDHALMVFAIILLCPASFQDPDWAVQNWVLMILWLMVEKVLPWHWPFTEWLQQMLSSCLVPRCQCQWRWESIYHHSSRLLWENLVAADTGTFPKNWIRLLAAPERSTFIGNNMLYDFEETQWVEHFVFCPLLCDFSSSPMFILAMDLIFTSSCWYEPSTSHESNWAMTKSSFPHFLESVIWTWP